MTQRVTLSLAEAAAMTGLSEAHIRRHAPVVRVGRRCIVPVAWVEGLAHHAVQEVTGDAETVGIRERVPAGGRAVGRPVAPPRRVARDRDEPEEPGRGESAGPLEAGRITIYDFGEQRDRRRVSRTVAR